MNDTRKSGLSLQITRWFDAPREPVFDAWLSETWGEWLAPVGAHCKVVAQEPHVGGSYHVSLSRPDGSSVNITGIYQELVRPSRLVLNWLRDNSPETVITVTFEHHGKGTAVTLRQTGFEDQVLRDGYEKTWTSSGGPFDKLAAVVAASLSDGVDRGTQ